MAKYQIKTFNSKTYPNFWNWKVYENGVPVAAKTGYGICHTEDEAHREALEDLGAYLRTREGVIENTYDVIVPDE